MIPSIIIMLMLISSQPGIDVETYSLKQCIDYALDNNTAMKVALYGTELSHEQIKEHFGTALPQIEGSGRYTNNIQIPTMIMTGEGGNSFPIMMGVKHDILAGVSLSQKLFDQSFWVALGAANLNDKLADQNVKKQEEEIVYNVAYAYYPASVLKKQLAVLKEIVEASAAILKSTELEFKAGAIRKIEVDKLQVNHNMIVSRMLQLERNHQQALNNLKYAMGMPIETEIQVEDVTGNFIDSSYYSVYEEDDDIVKSRIDYKIQETRIQMQEKDRAYKYSALFPTLSLFGNYNVEAFGDKFDLLDQKKQWYSSSSIGLNLRVPIFTGLSARARIEQSAVNVEIEKENLKYLKQSLKNQLSNYSIQYKNVADNIQNESENLELANLIYRNTQIEFTHGAVSAVDLIQAESSLYESQNVFYSKLLELYLAQLDLEKNKGTLISFVKDMN